MRESCRRSAGTRRTATAGWDGSTGCRRERRSTPPARVELRVAHAPGHARGGMPPRDRACNDRDLAGGRASPLAYPATGGLGRCRAETAALALVSDVGFGAAVRHLSGEYFTAASKVSRGQLVAWRPVRWEAAAAAMW